MASPYYSLDQIKQLVAAGSFEPASDRTARDCRELGGLDWRALFNKVVSQLDVAKHFDKHHPCCHCSLWDVDLPADSYTFCINMDTGDFEAFGFTGQPLYLKAGITQYDDGADFVFIVSFHRST